MTRQSDKTRDSIRRVLEDHLADVVSSDVATRIVQQARAASNGASEAAQARTASRAPGSGVARIESAARGQSSRGRLAAILVEIATQGMASTGEAHAIAEAAYDVLGSGTHRIPLATGLGRTLLREAAIRRSVLPQRACRHVVRRCLGPWLRMAPPSARIPGAGHARQPEPRLSRCSRPRRDSGGYGARRRTGRATPPPV